MHSAALPVPPSQYSKPLMRAAMRCIADAETVAALGYEQGMDFMCLHGPRTRVMITFHREEQDLIALENSTKPTDPLAADAPLPEPDNPLTGRASFPGNHIGDMNLEKGLDHE